MVLQQANLILTCLSLAILWSGTTALADPLQVAQNGRLPAPPAAVPDPMDEQALRNLIAQPHESEDTIPELRKLARPGIYRRELTLIQDGQNTDTSTLVVTVTVVNRRFLVQQPHPEEQSRSLDAVSVWTYDRTQQNYRAWFGTSEGRILEARGTPVPRSRLFQLEFVKSPDRRDETIKGTCEVSGDEEEFFILEGESRHGQSRTVWKAVFVRQGDIGDPLRGRNWIERNTLLFVLLVNAGWFLPFIIGCLIARRISRRRAEQRTGDFEEAASDLDLQFQPDGNTSLQNRLAGFPVMEIGRGRKLFNLIVAATPEVTLFLFDYSYVTGYGKNRRVRHQSVAAVESADLLLPEFHLRPERKLDVIGGLLGQQDIDFDDHPEFSRAFVLKSDVEQETRNFFDQQLLDFLSDQPDISLEASQGRFLFFRRWKLIKPEAQDVRQFLGETHTLLRTLQDRLARSS